MTGAVSSGLGVIPVECEYVVRTEENKERWREEERDRAERGKERQRAVQIIRLSNILPAGMENIPTCRNAHAICPDKKMYTWACRGAPPAPWTCSKGNGHLCYGTRVSPPWASHRLFFHSMIYLYVDTLLPLLSVVKYQPLVGAWSLLHFW